MWYKYAILVNVWPYLVKYLILSRSISFFFDTVRHLACILSYSTRHYRQAS